VTFFQLTQEPGERESHEFTVPLSTDAGMSLGSNKVAGFSVRVVSTVQII
jgi:hypothetical protein